MTKKIRKFEIAFEFTYKDKNKPFGIKVKQANPSAEQVREHLAFITKEILEELNGENL